MANRKYPRLKRCECCGRTLFLRHFRKLRKGRNMQDWAVCCLKCEQGDLKGI